MDKITYKDENRIKSKLKNIICSLLIHSNFTENWDIN